MLPMRAATSWTGRGCTRESVRIAREERGRYRASVHTGLDLADNRPRLPGGQLRIGGQERLQEWGRNMMPGFKPTFLARPGAYLYHCTDTAVIGSIRAQGLRPSSGQTHWGGELGQESLGKVFFSRSMRDSAYYCSILVREHLAELGLAHVPLMLRVRSKLLRDAKSDDPPRVRDWYVRRLVPPQHIEVFWQGQWHWLSGADWFSPDMAYSIEDGTVIDWEGASIGSVDDAMRDARKIMGVREERER
jgi:hypothetical protein